MKFLERFWFGCGHCHGPEGCPWVEAAGCTSPDAFGASGRGLVLCALAVFILPLASAIAGAHLVGRWCVGLADGSIAAGQAAGIVVGFLVGVGVAKVVLLWLRPKGAGAGGGKA